MVSWLAGAPAPRNDDGCSRPISETEPSAGAGGSAVAGDIMRPGHVEMLDGTADADPHADLGAAGIELFPRQGLQLFAVLALKRIDDPAVELLIDDKVAQAPRADDADAGVARVTLDRGADRLAELPAAPRRRLVWRVIGVEEHRHDRQVGVLHQPLAHKSMCVAFAVPGRQSVRGGDVELAVDQFADQMPRQRPVDRIIARLLLLVITRSGEPRPFRALETGRERHVADRVTIIDEDRRQVILMEQLLLVIAYDDQ